MILQFNKSLDTFSHETQASAKVLSFSQRRKFFSDKKIGFKTAEGIQILNVKDILRCQAEGNYTQIHLQSGKKIIISKTLKKVEDHLNHKGFVRIHQSHLVALKEVEFIGKSQLSLRNGEGLPISRRMKDKLLNVLSRSMPVL